MLSVVTLTEAPENLPKQVLLVFIFYVSDMEEGGIKMWGKMDAIIYGRTLFDCVRLGFSQEDCGGFHLHLLVFPFVYQFNSRIVAVVCSSFANV